MESTRLQRGREERELKRKRLKSLGLVTLMNLPAYVKTIIDLWLLLQ